MRFLSGYSDEKWYNRWFEHFNYFDTRSDKIPNFEAIKLVDIRFRKDYLGEPFDFNMQYYNEEIEKRAQRRENRHFRKHSQQTIQFHPSLPNVEILSFQTVHEPRPLLDHPVPFKTAPAATLRLPCTSSVQRRDTSSAHAPPPPSTMAKPYSAKSKKETSPQQKGRSLSAGAGTSEAPTPRHATTTAKINESTSAPFAEKNPITPSPGHVDVTLASRACRTEKPYFDFLPLVIPRQPLPFASPANEMIRSKIVTPYNADAFEYFLNKYNLSDTYPHLVRNLRNGFPLGEFPELEKHVILQRPELVLAKTLALFGQQARTAALIPSGPP